MRSNQELPPKDKAWRVNTPNPSKGKARRAGEMNYKSSNTMRESQYRIYICAALGVPPCGLTLYAACEDVV